MVKWQLFAFFNRAPARGVLASLTVILALTPATQHADAQQVDPQRFDGRTDRDVPSCNEVPDRFGRMFGHLPAASWPTADVDLLAGTVMAEEEDAETPEGQADPEENEAIDAGVTYVGQFIDHDLTLDPRPNDLTTPTDPSSLHNFRTPAFDLDSVYGAGPSGSPQLYEADGLHLRLGSALTGSLTDAHAVDLPRGATGQALLGDPRNDENRIVAQLHSIFLRFHNLVADRLAQEHPNWSNARVFEDAQRQVRLHYQWAVLTDFLPTIVGNSTMGEVLPSMNAREAPPHLAFYNPCREGMPVEFSVAAYRFGHSLVRPIYRINTSVADRLPVFSLTNDPTKDLGGFRPSPQNFAIDWRFFFLMEAPRRVGQPQASYKIDNSLVFPLSLLPLPDTGTGPASLAQRNLLRSMQLGLPSGQAVARAMGVRPLRDDQILIGKATGDPADAVAISDLAPSFAGRAPLWTYTLAEATESAFNVRDGHIVGPQVRPMRLGPVGGRIVAETFVGLMAVDRSSVLYDSSFHPHAAFSRNGQFGFRELIRSVITATDPTPRPTRTPTATASPTATSFVGHATPTATRTPTSTPIASLPTATLRPRH